jgi:hypothetical protein
MILGMLAVSLGIALCLSRYEIAKAQTWRGRSYALQSLLEQQGFEIVWHPKSESMMYRRAGGPFGRQTTNLEYYDSK